MTTHNDIPLNLAHLLPILDDKLIDLLESLTEEEWQSQTIAKLWTVKDVVAHLLDGNIRMLSISRDNYFGESTNAQNFRELVYFLNGLNASWVKAMKRVSPAMLILLHKTTGRLYCDHHASLDPFAKAVFAVDWAGQKESKNWMHIAREYTEKWLHQQQIRDAVNRPGIMTREFFYPVLETFVYALPHTYRNVKAEEGTGIKFSVSTPVGGDWYLERKKGTWNLTKDELSNPSAEIIIDPDTSWKLFSKSLRPEDVKDKVTMRGDQLLAEVALNMVSVMA